MAKIDLYDPKWVDMVFAGKNQAYGAYRLRKGTSGRNIKSIVILLITRGWFSCMESDFSKECRSTTGLHGSFTACKTSARG